MPLGSFALTGRLWLGISGTLFQHESERCGRLIALAGVRRAETGVVMLTYRDHALDDLT